MGRVTLPLEAQGLSFTVEILLDNIPAVKAKLKAEGKPVPPPYKTRALVDTGASSCAATEKVIRALKLPTKSDAMHQVMTAGGPIDSKAYFGALSLVDAPDIKVDYVTITRYDFTGAPFDFIIGMTALMRWNFWYSRAEQKMTIEVLPPTT